jgi:hypothetical protein
MKNTLGLFCLLTLVTSGCSVARFEVNHAKLKAPVTTREGTVVLAPFKDSRGVTNATIIGGAGEVATPKPRFVTAQGKPLSEILTDDFREALEVCGYQVRTAPAPDLRILQGEISEFWLTTGWKAVCKTRVALQLKDSDTGPSVWEKTLASEEDDLMIVPNAMSAALDTLLKEAVQAFSAPDFAEALRRKPAAAGQ